MNQILRAACAALAAALMAGCAAFTALRALGFQLSWMPVYAAALAAAAAVYLGRRGMAWAAGAAVLWIAVFGFLLSGSAGSISALVRDFAAARGLSAEQMIAHAAAGRSLALLAALLLGMFFALLMSSPSGVSSVLMVLLSVIICAFATSEDLSLWLAVPGLVAAVAAFSMSYLGERDGMRPLLLVPAAVVVAIALALVPAQRSTWEPLENAANRIRSIVEDYIRFTEERMAFTINEKGYNRAGLIGDNVVAMLGGPANPTKDAVMRVQTDENLLLRGTIKRSYTGFSWVDDQAKARYLYYDFTHRGVRQDVFSADAGEKDANFKSVTASVEMLESGTSTLFVPAVLAEFDMPLSDAVYYNSTGEIFLTRDVQPGDSYAFSTRLPVNDAALISAASAASGKYDKRYEEMLANYTALPQGVDSRVYALAMELTQNLSSPAEKALAIQKYLMENCAYTLKGGYPPGNQDFVSWFLLEEKQGYCSYFASAMAVLCRISGLPARYVEGYFVRAEEDGETIVTGKNAHAWVEVYLNGLGWTPFDPTARAVENQRGESGNEFDDTDDIGGGDTPFENDGDASSAPTPTPTPDIGSSPESDPELGDDPTPEPEGGDPSPSPSPDSGDSSADNPPEDDDSSGETPPDDPGADDASSPESENDSSDNQNRNRSWLWILLAVLLLLALGTIAFLWGKKRLTASDPLKMCVSTRSGQTAALILYRGILTLLLQAGLAPQNGETPEQFAARASQTLPNPYYEAFVSELVRSRYSGKPLTRETIDAGRRSYVHFLDNMRASERIRFHLRRMLHGIGDLENIP